MCYETAPADTFTSAFNSAPRLIKELRIDGTMNATKVSHSGTYVYSSLVTGTKAWMGGTFGTFSYSVRGQNGPAVNPVLSPTQSVSAIIAKLEIYNGTFYIHGNNDIAQAYTRPPFHLATLPAGPPTTSNQLYQAIPFNLATEVPNPQRFFVYSNTVLYGGSIGSVYKFTSSQGTFNVAYSASLPGSPPIFGVTVRDVSGTITLFVATNDRVYKLTDSGTAFSAPTAFLSVDLEKATLQDVCIIPKAASCTDGLLNQAESDVDCGVSCGKPCADGKKCSLLIDCISLVCNAVTKICSK